MTNQETNKPKITYKIIGESVLIKDYYKNGKPKYKKVDIVQISPTGIYCNDDNFYPLHYFN